MADKRMFSKFVTDSDNFLDMPLTAQALYFHLGMSGDDDGFVANPKKVLRSVGGSADDLKRLIAKGFVITFNSGVIVITHWNIHNSLRKDRKKNTVFLAELAQLGVNENGVYYFADSQLTTKCQPTDNQVSTECPLSIVEYSIDKGSIGERGSEPNGSKPTRHKYGTYKNVLLSDEELSKLKEEIPSYSDYIERLSEYVASTGKKYKSHFATIRAWARKDNAKAPKADNTTEYKDYFDMIRKGEL